MAGFGAAASARSINARSLFPGRFDNSSARCGTHHPAIRAQVITPDRISKLVAYVVPDGVTPLESVEVVLRETLDSIPVIVTIGVPFFYYTGMMVEVDVYGSADPSSNP